MSRKVSVFIVVICIVCLVATINLNIKLFPETHTKIRDNTSGRDYFIPVGWTGIPISKNNPLYSDVDKSTHINGMKLLKEQLLAFTKDQWEENDELWIDIFDDFENIVGWNGIFDAIAEAETELKYDSASRRHALGEELYNRTPNVKFGVEIAARNILHKAPLHGLIWKEIEAFGVSNIEEFLIRSDEICFFKNAKDMGNVWISCKFTIITC